jgi:predicted Ser/Thr protein kinase
VAVTDELTTKAQAWARALVQRGVLGEEQAKQAFFAYWDALQQGNPGTFPAYLVAKGILTQSAVEGLTSDRLPQQDEAPPAAPGWGSAVVRKESHPAAAPPPPPPAPRQTDLLPKADASGGDPTPDVERTLAFAKVLPTQRPPAPPPSAEAPVGLDDVPYHDSGAQRLSSTCREADADPALDLAQSDQAAAEERFFADSNDEEDLGVDTEPPKVGQVLDDYLLTGELGRGAMGIIFDAKHQPSGERVALKVLLGMDRPGAKKRRQRFQREVEALRRLHHENIVRVHTCGRVGLHDYYVMDFVEGRELRDLLQEPGALSPKRRLEVFEAICAAVSHAHERGVVHRDLKPANVLIDAEGKVLVLDFGLAKLLGDDDEKEKMELTRSNATIGTPYYMSPEQFTDAKGVDWRADVYGLGVLLFEMLIGRRPFEGETAGELIKKVLQDPVPLPTSLSDKVTPKFDEIVLKALEKDRTLRYQQVEELRLAVASYRRGAFQQTSAVDQAAGRAQRWLSANKVPFAVGVVVASLFWIPVVAVAWFLG